MRKTFTADVELLPVVAESSTSRSVDASEATLAYNNLSGVGRGGTGTLKVDGKVVSTQKIEQSVPLSVLLDQRFFIGISGPTPMDDRD